jgi:hypothetical protein
VYAYCILDHNSSYTTVTHLTFSIDGIQVGTFEHTPDGSNTFTYNALVYMNTSIPSGQHTFVIHNPTTIDSLILFDYVVYTYVFLGNMHETATE